METGKMGGMPGQGKGVYLHRGRRGLKLMKLSCLYIRQFHLFQTPEADLQTITLSIAFTICHFL